MKIYIAGPITGIYSYKKNFNNAERRLTKKGHTVLNPSTLPGGLHDYMPICKAMIDQADAIYLLKGWEKSIGSNEEAEYTEAAGKEILFEEFDK